MKRWAQVQSKITSQFSLKSLNKYNTQTYLKVNLGLGRETCQHAVIDEFLYMVTGCALGTDVCHWMFNKKSTWFKVNKVNKIPL